MWYVLVHGHGALHHMYVQLEPWGGVCLCVWVWLIARVDNIRCTLACQHLCPTSWATCSVILVADFFNSWEHMGRLFIKEALKTPLLYQPVLKWNGFLLCYLFVCQDTKYKALVLSCVFSFPWSTVLKRQWCLEYTAIELCLSMPSFSGAYGVVLKCRHKVRSDSFSHNHLRCILVLPNPSKTPSKFF